MLERIISRGAYGPERAALEVAEIFGLLTGGQSRRGTTSPGEASRFGLAVDPCSRRQALLANVRRADGTIILGPVSRSLLRQLEKCGRVFEIQMVLSGTPKWVADWIDRFNIRTLNIVGLPDCEWSMVAGQFIAEVLARLGRRPRLPVSRGCGIVADLTGLYAVRLWRTQRAWLWRGGTVGWKPVRRDGWIVELKFRCGHQWFKPLLPPEVLRAISPGGLDLDCRMLTLISRLGQTALDLADAGRWAVLAMLSCPSAFVDRPVGRHVVRQLAKARQRDLIGALGFPATEWAVRLLAKVSQTVGGRMLLRLRQMLFDPNMVAMLRHLPTINRSVMEVLGDPVFLQWTIPAFLNVLAGCRENMETLALHELHDDIQRTGIQPRAGSIRSMSDFWGLCAALQSASDASAGPPPPLPNPLRGIIKPLTTAAQLRTEGQQMRHCVGDYHEQVRVGRCLIFRILPDPQLGNDRATLMLRPAPGGDIWRVAQLSGEQNQPVSEATRRLVDVWLKHAMAELAISVKELRNRCITEMGIIVADLAA